MSIPNQAQFDLDVAAIESDMPCTLYFPAESQTGLTAQKTQTLDQQLGVDAGYSQEYNFNLLVRKSLFGTSTPPAPEREIEVLDESGTRRKYTVKSVTPSQDGVMLDFVIKQSN